MSVTSAIPRKDIGVNPDIKPKETTVKAIDPANVSIAVQDSDDFSLCTFTAVDSGYEFSYFYTPEDFKTVAQGAATEDQVLANQCLPKVDTWKVRCQSCTSSQECSNTAQEQEVDVEKDSDDVTVAYKGMCAARIDFTKYVELIYDNNKEAILGRIAEIEETFLKQKQQQKKKLINP